MPQGKWTITIQGEGPHHSGAIVDDIRVDANRMTVDFARLLRERGHRIEKVTFVHGGEEDLREYVDNLDK